MARNILNIDSGLRQINPRSGSSVFVDLSSNQTISGIKRFLNNLITNSDVNFNTTANVGRIIFNPNEPAGSGSQIVSIYTEDEIDGQGWFFDSVGNLYYLGDGIAPVKIMLSGATGDLTILSNFNGFGDIICHNILTSNIISSYSGGNITFNNGIALGSNTINSGDITSNGTISGVDISSTGIIFANDVNLTSTGYLNVNNITSSVASGSYQTKISLSNEFIDTNNSSLDIVATYIGFASPAQTLSTTSKYMFIKPLSTGDFEMLMNNIANKILISDWATTKISSQFIWNLNNISNQNAIILDSLTTSGNRLQIYGTASGTKYLYYNISNELGVIDGSTSQWKITEAGVITCSSLNTTSGIINGTIISASTEIRTNNIIPYSGSTINCTQAWNWNNAAFLNTTYISLNPNTGGSDNRLEIYGGVNKYYYLYFDKNNSLGVYNTFSSVIVWSINQSGNISTTGTITCSALNANSGTIQTIGTISGGTITASSSFISDLITASTGTATKNSIMMNNKFFNDTNGSIDLKAHYVGFPYLTQTLDLTSKYMAIIPKSDGNFSMEINNVGSKVFSTNWSTLTLTSDFNLALGSKTISTTGTVSTGAINGSTITASSSFISDLITASTGTATKNSIMMDNQFINGTNGSIDLKAHFVGFPYLTESLSLTSKYMFIKALSDGNFEMQINNVVGKLLYTDFTNKIIKTDWSWKWYDASGIFQASILNTGDIAGKTLTASGNITSTAIIQTSGSLVGPTTKTTLIEAILLNTYRNKIQMSNLFFNPDVASMDLVAQYIGFPHPALTLDIYSKYFFINPLTTGNVGFGINNISGYFLYTDWATRRVISEYTVGFRTAPFSSGYRYQTFLNNVTEIGSVSMLTGSTIAFNTSSDYRLKQDVIPIQNPLERLMKLKPKNYRFIADVEDECCCNCYMDGFIAHEIQEILPMIVTGEKDDPNQMQQMDYSKLTPICVGSIQELNEKIEKQQILIDKQQILIDSQYEMIKMLISRLEILELNNNLEQCNDIEISTS